MGGLLDLEFILRYGVLHVVRVGAAVSVLPFFRPGRSGVLMRLVLGIVLGATVAYARKDLPFEDPGDNPGVLTVAVLQEFVFGLLLGWLAGLILEAVGVAGGLIATEMGIHMANQVDPNTRTQLPITAFLFRNMGIILFFAAGGHHLVLRAFSHSFDAWPPGSMPPPDVLMPALLDFSGLVLTGALKVAAPVFFVLVVVTVCVGILAKMAPQLHVLEASFPIRILSGMLLLVIFLPSMMDAFDDLLESTGTGLFRLVGGG